MAPLYHSRARNERPGHPQHARRPRRHLIILLVQDESAACCPANFFTGPISRPRLKPASNSSFMAKRRSTSCAPRAPGNDQSANRSRSAAKELDSTEVARIVPIYEAIGTFGSGRFAAPCTPAVRSSISKCPTTPGSVARPPRAYPTRGEALIHTHFPNPENPSTLKYFSLTRAAAASSRGSFFLYQLSLALDRKATRKEKTPSPFPPARRRRPRSLKRILPFKPTAAQKRVLARNRRRPRKCLPR